ncbi:MAG: DUF5615 family PIN-like protein, partial [Candidatus Omnitrophica bacterium]|nr:DUF5615 family PIN-like protein [Candidatus Omnitrophota bacterium]
GHDVRDIRGTAQMGMTDDALWEIAQQEGRLLITTDKGFTQHREELHHGILIVRLKQPNRHKIHERVMQAMALFAAEEWCDSLVVMWDVMKSVWRNGGRS